MSATINYANAIINAGGTPDAITATLAAPSILTIDMLPLYLRTTGPNATTTPTLTLNGGAAMLIVKENNQPLALGDMNGVAELSLDLPNNRLVLLNPQASSGGGGSQDLEDVLTLDPSTGGIPIESPDGSSSLTVSNTGGAAMRTDKGADNAYGTVYTYEDGTAAMEAGDDNSNGEVSISPNRTRIAHSILLELHSAIVRFNALTGNRVPYLNVNKDLVSSSVTDTELGYLSGVTSAIQTQLNTKPKVEVMWGTTTAFSPADNTTTYVGVPTNLAVNASAPTRQMRGFTGTIIGFWAHVDPQSVLGSNELVTVNAKNITDGTSHLLGTISFDARGNSVYNAVATPLALDATKFYSTELVFPAFGTNPTTVTFLCKWLIR